MIDYDAIVIGSGHNGLTAATVMQRGGLRTLVLEKNKYSGGMAATVELFDGYRFEIAGSVLFPPAPAIVTDLGLDELETIESDVNSVTLGGPHDEPMIFYRDVEKLMEHVSAGAGIDALLGLGNLTTWAAAPSRALSRFEVRTEPRTYDEMYACATNEAERQAITEMLFSPVAELLNRYLPDGDKHRVIRGMLAFLAVNSTYRGPYSPGSATCLAYALATPPGAEMVTKLKGGIGAASELLRQRFESFGGELRLKTPVSRIITDDGRVVGVEIKGGDVITAPIVISNLDPGVTFTSLLDPAALPANLIERVSAVDHRAAYLQMHFALDGLPEYDGALAVLNEPGMQSSVGYFGSPEEMQRDFEDCRRGTVPRDPSMSLQIPSVDDPDLAPAGKHAASVYAMYFPVENDRTSHGRLKAEMGEAVIEKISRSAPNFRDLVTRHTTFASYHMESMFAAPAGDFCHGLIHPELMGANRPGPRGWRDLPVPIRGLYLGGAGCAGGPGITFVPGYNAGYEALDDAGR